VSADISYDYYNCMQRPTTLQEIEIVDFLHEHLQEYGDPKDHIRAAIRYACSLHKGEGGFVLLAREGSQLLGVTVVNQTGMSGYIPENILVYIAVRSEARGKGVGKGLMERALSMAKGNVALHVEPNNPAKHLYEKLGFTNKYLEMRYEKK
jgi:GNAT superfamily N-acetyltransferase